MIVWITSSEWQLGAVFVPWKCTLTDDTVIVASPHCFDALETISVEPRPAEAGPVDDRELEPVARLHMQGRRLLACRRDEAEQGPPGGVHRGEISRIRPSARQTHCIDRAAGVTALPAGGRGQGSPFCAKALGRQTNTGA